MKEIKLVGRELKVIRSIEHAGSTGAELVERTSMEQSDLLDVLNGLCESGYVEAYLPGQPLPSVDAIATVQFETARFEINPSYYQELKAIIQRR